MRLVGQEWRTKCEGPVQGWELWVVPPTLRRMGRLVDVEDLADAHGVAELLGLAHATSVHLYHADTPTCLAPSWSVADVELVCGFAEKWLPGCKVASRISTAS